MSRALPGVRGTWFENHDFYVYHRNHIDKLMVVAITGYAFDMHVENGGQGLKVGMYRVQAGRIAQKSQRAGRKMADGRMRFDGDYVRQKGDCYMVDCNVTGSNHGTSNAPKFSLKDLFESTVYPYIKDELVAEGKPFEGYTPIIQGDRAGPHNDDAFVRFNEEYCQQQGWVWEPQAPQMPYANNLDMVVFPAMSKRHSDTLRNYGSKSAPPDEIWRVASSVWKELDSALIARGYALQYRVMEKVIKHKGKNDFLRSRQCLPFSSEK